MTAHSRLALGLHDAAWLIVAATAAATAFPAPALAYVDPSVMTYTIQALAGVAVALSAVLGVAFRRSRRALMRLLRIDEDARKQAEPDLVAIDPDAAGASAAFAAEDEAAREAKRTLLAQAAPKPLAWRGRFARALLASLFLVGTLFIVAPLEVVGQSTFGLLFGLLCAPVCLFTAGLHGAIVWWINGIPFDVIHCIGNFGIALVLFCPLRRLLERLYQGMQARRGGYPPPPP